MRAARSVLAITTVILLATLAAACSSSSKTSGPATSTAAGSCPFSGSLNPQSQPGGGSGTELVDVVPRTAGCIDNVQFNFDPTVAASEVSYDNPTTLRVKLTGTTLGSKFNSSSSISSRGLNHVKSVQVSTAPTGEVDWTLTLDEQRPFITSQSQVPPYVDVAIG